MTFIYELDPYTLEMNRMSDASRLLILLSSVAIACECVHLIRRGNFRSRDKDGGHTSRSATAVAPGISHLIEHDEDLCCWYIYSR